MAGTTADKLALLENTKEGLKAAIAEKGIIPSDVFSDYPDMVRAIQTGAALETCSVQVMCNVVGYVCYVTAQDGALKVEGTLVTPSSETTVTAVKNTVVAFASDGTSSYTAVPVVLSGSAELYTWAQQPNSSSYVGSIFKVNGDCYIRV